MQCLRWLFVLCLVATSSSAFASTAGLDAAVERAKFIVHLKVVGLERSNEIVQKSADGKVRYGDDRAVCEVKKIVLGMVATDMKGRVRITSASEKSTVELENPVRYKVGDELTLVASNCMLDRKVGMILPGDALHFEGAPGSELLDRLDERVTAAEHTRDALAKLLPGAQKEVEKALKEFDEQKRNDFKDLSPDADLLFDFCAIAQYTPDLADFARPKLNEKQRARLAKLALRALCGINEEAAAIAAELVEGKGGGAYKLLRPAALDESKALESLGRLSARKALAPVLLFLCRHDAGGRALNWAAKLAAANNASAAAAEWALIQCSEEGYVKPTAVKTALAGKKDALSVAVEKHARRLACWLLLSRAADKPVEKVQGSENVNKEVQYLYGRTEMLQVYTYVLGMRGADEERVKAVRGNMEGKVHGHGELDLSDFNDLARELRYKEKMPQAVRRLLKRKGPERR
jgi:hypothetical protein